MTEDTAEECCEDCGRPIAEYDGGGFCPFCIKFNHQLCEECEE